MSITPFHFACHCEERLRAQCDVLDVPLGVFMVIMRRFSLTDTRATLQFGAKPALGEDFAPHVSLLIMLVPQKEAKTAFNFQLDCPSQKLHKTFRLVLNTVEEAETQILKILDFLQKAFLPLGYTTVAPKKVGTRSGLTSSDPMAMATGMVASLESSGGTATAEEEEISPEELAKILAPSDGPAVDPMAMMAAAEAAKAPAPKQATQAPIPPEKKYVYEAPKSGDTVRLKDHSGKYVPDGQLPATLRVIKSDKK